MSSIFSFIPIKYYLPGWPADIIGYSNELDAVGVKNLVVRTATPSRLIANGTIQILTQVSFNLPLLPGLSLIILNNHEDIRMFNFYFDFHNSDFDLDLKTLSVSIQFQTTLLKRMEKILGGFVESSPEPTTGAPHPVEISIEGIDFSFNSVGEFTFSFPEGAPGLTIPPFMIANSGIIVEISSLKLIFSAAEALSLPETIPSDWRGVYLEEAYIHLPEGLSDILPDSVGFTDAFIGSGGFSGSVFLDWEVEHNITEYDESEAKPFLGFGFTLQKLTIGFNQNTLTQSSITGFLKVPFFDEAVKVDVGLTNDGDFTVGLGSDTGLLILEKPGIISIQVSSLEFVKIENSFSIKLSGTITPLVAGFNWPSFELKGLTISSDGTVLVEGGWIELPDMKVLDFHGFKIEIAKLGFGSDEENGILYKWIGFSGGIQIINELPLQGGVEGLKLMWPEVGLAKIKIGGVYLSFEIPGVLTFDGSVYFIDEPATEGREAIKEFRGGVDLTIIPINLGVDAQFITGRAPDYNYFFISIGLDLPVGIPLGPPVLGLYGLAGLYGHNMTLNYQELIDYDDVDDRPDLTDILKWHKEQGAMAFGAGITLGTLPDASFTVKAKALFVILIPGPVLLIEGHAGMLSTGESFLMRVLAVLDMASGTFLMNISATYSFPKDSGELLDVAGSAEAFFSAADPNNWHLYLGENKPESKRIRADILGLFKAQTYLMVDAKGLLMGAWIGYGLNEKYGILRVVLEAWMSGELALSLMPLQVKGSITLYGNAELSASIVKLGISVMANATAQAPKPLSLLASLKVQLKTPLGNPKATISLKWETTIVPPYPLPLSTKLGVEHRKVSKNWEIPKYSKYQVDLDGLYQEDETDTFPPIPTVPVVPPDVYLVLNFDKPIIDFSDIAANPVAISNEYEEVGDYEFKYELLGIKLEYCDTWDETTMEDGDWKEYTLLAEDYSLSGYWQFIPGATQGNTKLILNASTPFEISRLLDSSDMWFNMVNVYNPDYPCQPRIAVQTICSDFEDREYGTYYSILVQDDFIFTSPFPMNVHGYRARWLGTQKTLNNVDSYHTIECLNIKVQAPTGQINSKIIKEVIITAGIGYDSYLKFTDEYSKTNIELYINLSSLGTNGVPAFIHFPQVAFPALPYKVWITCIVADTSQKELFYAFDREGKVVDTANLRGGAGEVVVYQLQSLTTAIWKIGMIGLGIRIIEICYEAHHSVVTDSILITPPESLVRADLHLSKNAQGTLFLYDEENREVKQVEFSIPSTLPDEEMQPISFSLETGAPFRSFLVVGNFDIISVCGVTQEAQDIFAYNSGLRSHLQTSLEETWGKHTSQILTPNKYYRLSIETCSNRRKNRDDWPASGLTFMEYMFFKTGNPPGPPAETQREVGEDKTLRYDLYGPLTSLSPYIDYTIPAGATADEAQSFIYRTYDIGIVYNDSYIEQMYWMADLRLAIRLVDHNNLPVTNAAGEELIFENIWGDNPQLAITREEERYEDILLDNTCQIVMTTLTSETKKEIIASSRELLLKPQIQYRAQIIAADVQVYEFAFITSRYTSFTHHIQSFDQVIWNHFALLQDTTYQLDDQILELILTNGENEQTQFEQMMEFFSLNPRPLPQRTEIMLMNDQHDSYGFLLETPEPIDWPRTTLEVAFSEKKNVMEEPFSSFARIVGGSSPDITLVNNKVSADYNSQWIDVLLLETMDLKDYTLEYEINPGEGIFQTYHLFEQGINNAGTMFRVYNGVAPESLTETEYVSIYSAHQSNLSSANGRVFRLCDPDGIVMAMFVLYNVDLFNVVNSSLIRNEDSTRLFIFITKESQLFSQPETGTYQLSFTYKRDIGSSKPVLRRFGFSTQEETLLQFTLDYTQQLIADN